MNEWMGEWKIFISFEYTGKSIKVKGMMELKNHQLATIVLMIDLGKNHQWLKLIGKSFFEKQDIYTVSKYLPTEQLSITIGKQMQLYSGENSQYSLITSTGTTCYHVLLI